ncbi:MAG: hypothetical protein Q9187_002165 [Circinaria calcarea]
MELASAICIRTAEIDGFLTGQDLPKPSFAVDALVVTPLPEDISASRDAVLDAMDELHALILGPLHSLMRLTSPAVNIFMSLQAIHRFKIASNLALDEQVSYKELGSRCGLSESNIKRFLRLAIANRIFLEPRKGFVRHTASSRLLAELPALDQWIGLVCEEMWPSATRAVDAMIRWPGSEEPIHTGWHLVNNKDGPFFTEIAKSPERHRRFADAMHFIQNVPQFDPSYLINNLGWDDPNRPKLIVDIGGSHGSIAIEMLKKFPSLRCIVEDRPEIIADAKVPAQFEGRLSFREQDFFTEQGVKGADVYFFRSVFHDWSDSYALRILRNLVPALKPGAKIILNEICLPEPGVLSCYQEQFLRYETSAKGCIRSKVDRFVPSIGVTT